MIKKIWERLSNKEVFSYLVFGVLTTAVDWVVYSVLLELSVDYKIAQVMAWTAAVLFAYITNKIWVFENRNFKPGYMVREIASFVGCRLVTGVLNLVLLILLVDCMHMGQYISKVFIAVIVIVLNYVFSKLFIFKQARQDKERA